MTNSLKYVLLSSLMVFSFVSCIENPKEADKKFSELDATNEDTRTDEAPIKKYKTTEPSNHRASATTCDNFRPTLPVVSLDDPQPCREHSDCTAGSNGRCSFQDHFELASRFCSYDRCFTDDECAADEVCRCGEDIHADNRIRTDANRCVPSDCRTDADCPTGHWCKASPSDCGDANGLIVSYFCTTDADECRDNSDCEQGVCHFPFFDGGDAYYCGGADCD